MRTKYAKSIGVSCLQKVENLGEKVRLSFVESVRNFTQVKMEESFMHSPVVVEPVFGVAPESFNAVDVVAADWPALLFPHHDMIAANRKRGIRAPVVGEVERPRFRVFPNEREYHAFATLGYRKDLDPAVAFEDAEDDDLAGGAPTALAPSAPAKRALVEFNRSAERLLTTLVDGEDGANNLKESLNGFPVAEMFPSQSVDRYAEDEVVEEPPFDTIRQTAYLPDAARLPACAAPATFAPFVRKKP